MTMLKGAVLAGIFILATALGSYAERPAKLPDKDIHATLQESIHFPILANKSDYVGTAKVVFVIDEGQIVVKSVKSENPDLSTYIKEAMKKVNCKEIRSPMNQHYSVTFHFSLV